MSKVDPTQDYYGALEISPDASEDDIRKQYRKLALKLHPDRHPGQEAEFQPRFQQIQAAYECLTDPEQRRKYEVSRRMRATGASAPRPGPSGQRGNPYKASSNFPPPPRPPGAPPRRTDPASHPPPQAPPRSGAERYTNFPNPPPRRAPEVSSARSDAKSRANVFNAWQNMNNAQKTQAQRAQGYAVPPAWDGPRADSGASGATPPRSAYDAVNGQQRPTSSRTSSARVPPRSQHYQQDSSAPSGDDSSTSRQRDRPFGRSNPPRMTTDFPPRVPPRAAPTAKRPEGGSGGNPNEDAPFTEGSRERTPYSSTPGERTSFFAKSDTIRRTASVRDATKLDPRFDPTTGRPRSLSPTSRANNARANTTATKSRPQPSRASSGRPWMHYSESSDASSEDELPAPRRASYAHGAAVNPADRPKAKPSSSWQKRRDEASPALNKSKSYDDQRSAADGQDVPGEQGVRSQSSIFNLNTGVNDPRTFSNSNSPQPGFTTQFSPTDGPPPVFSPTPPRVGSPKSAYVFPAQVSPTSQMPPPPPPAHPQNVSSEGEQSAGSGRDFRPEGWQQAFSQENWASHWAQAPQSKPASPTRPSASSARRTRAGPARSNSQVPPRLSTRSEAAQAHLEEGLRPSAAATAEDDAMDIDEEMPSMSQGPSVVPDTGSNVSSSAAANAAPHQIYGEPRPDWRTPSVNNSRRPSASNAQAQQSRPPNGQEPLLPPPSSTSSGPDISLSGFRHVLPGGGLPANGTGIRNLADLSSTLPFDSRPATSHPAKGPLASSDGETGTDADAEAEKIARSIPRPPLAPLVPSNLNKAHWDTYLAQMTDYVAKWNTYNARMVAHFQDFAVSLADYSHPRVGGDGSTPKVIDNWLGAMGETQNQKGWDSYVRELKEDGIWRTAWAEASQRHAEAVARHHNVRERLREKMERGL